MASKKSEIKKESKCVKCLKEITTEEYLKNDYRCKKCNKLPNYWNDKKCDHCPHPPHEEKICNVPVTHDPDFNCECEG